MSTYNAIFVRGGNGEVIARVKDRYPSASVEKGPRFLCIDVLPRDFDVPDDLLKELSMHGEVYWVTIQSAAETFQYVHWDNGILRRALVYEHPNWVVVAGDPEPWERQAFFLDDFQQLPSWSKYHPNQNPEQKKPLSIGPDFIDSKDALHSVLGYYNFQN
ncbi:hypothetical protein BH10CYA1_BH10CYA1_03310 [soil metagenome]